MEHEKVLLKDALMDLQMGHKKEHRMDCLLGESMVYLMVSPKVN